jgi:hypothetical protein
VSHHQPWPEPLSTVRLDDGPLSELSRRERWRMQRAMMWGRPLPPRLARAAVQYAPKLQRQSWRGWLLLLALFFAVPGVGLGSTPGVSWWVPVGYAIVAVGWLLQAGQWLWAARRAGRAVREGHWPERTEQQP